MVEAARALLALWNDVDPALDAAYNDWHANEHVPERLTVPGMLWGLRWGRAAGAAQGPRYLTLYGLRDAAVLDSEPYQRLLREPTPMSRRMRPALANLSRWVCDLEEFSPLDRGQQLAVWTLEAPPAEPSHDYRRSQLETPARAHLLAHRLPQARALPWLDAGQGRAIEGDWLACVAFDAGAAQRLPRPAGATLYARLPVA